MRIKQMFPPRFIGTAHVPLMQWCIATIAGVDYEEGKDNTTGEVFLSYRLFIREHKTPIKLNKTVAEAIGAVFGSDETEDWDGNEFAFRIVEAFSFGKKHESVEIYVPPRHGAEFPPDAIRFMEAHQQALNPGRARNPGHAQYEQRSAPPQGGREPDKRPSGTAVEAWLLEQLKAAGKTLADLYGCVKGNPVLSNALLCGEDDITHASIAEMPFFAVRQAMAAACARWSFTPTQKMPPQGAQATAPSPVAEPDQPTYQPISEDDIPF